MHLLSVCVASQIDFAEKETPFQSNHHRSINPDSISPVLRTRHSTTRKKIAYYFFLYGGLTLPGKNVPRTGYRIQNDIQ